MVELEDPFGWKQREARGGEEKENCVCTKNALLLACGAVFVVGIALSLVVATVASDEVHVSMVGKTDRVVDGETESPQVHVHKIPIATDQTLIAQDYLLSQIHGKRFDPYPPYWRSKYNPQIRLPYFYSPHQLNQWPEWANYLSKVYGTDTLRFPIDLRGLVFLHDDWLPKDFASEIEPWVATAPTVFGNFMHLHFGQSARFLAMHIFGSYSSPVRLDYSEFRKNLGPFAVAFPSGIANHTKVEVVHECCDGPNEGLWMYLMPGSGVFFDLGKTIVFEQHGAACEYFGKLSGAFTTCPWICCAPMNEFVWREARKQGYDSVQYMDTWMGGSDTSSYEVVDLASTLDQAAKSVATPARKHCFGDESASRYTRGWSGQQACKCVTGAAWMECERPVKPLPVPLNITIAA
jgi:hypothetical protein